MKRRLSARAPILILLGLCLLAGMGILPDYGASWDEPNLRLYAAAALKAYSPAAWLDPAFRITDTYGPTNHRYYGPAYVMAAQGLVNLLRVNPFSWSEDALWHLASFLTFLASAYALWSLCRRVMRPGAALAAAALYLTQPLLWGHAMINPKDIPFMAAFLIAVTTGIGMIEQARQPLLPAGKSAAPVPRWLLLPAAAGLSLFLLLSVHARSIQALSLLAVSGAQSAPESLAGQIFARFASSAAVIPAEDYVRKIMAGVNGLRWSGGLAALLCLLAAAGARWWAEILTQAAVLRSPRVFWRVILAGAALGLCVAIRLVGPLAGVLVGAAALWRLRARAIPVLAGYGLAALGAGYLSWPYLWADPLRNLSEALAVMSNFPDPFPVRVNGVFFIAQNLPAYFLPLFFGITLTMPAVVLILAGIGLAGRGLVRGGKDRLVLALLLAYFILPVAAWMVWRPPLYDNGRQYFFVLPAAFALGGLAFEALFSALGRWARGSTRLRAGLAGGLLAAALLPGLVEAARIHPYQYAYYNAFVGGQAGAFRRFEVDYWLTSYKEAAGYLNAAAPPGASIVIFGSVIQLEQYTDPGFTIQKYPLGAEEADYALLATRSDIDLELFPQGEVVFTVGRQGAVYAVVKKLR